MNSNNIGKNNFNCKKEYSNNTATTTTTTTTTIQTTNNNNNHNNKINLNNSTKNNINNESLINLDFLENNSNFLKTLPFNKNSNVTIGKCRNYLNNVKIRLINDPVSYKTFEIILKEYYSDPQNINYQDVYNEVALLFNDNHQDLLNQLSYFLPFQN